MIHDRHFQLDNDEQALRCQTLWRHVLMEAVRNAEDRIAGNNMSPHRSEALQRQSSVWLEGRSGDFREVCEFAGLDPSRVRSAWKNGTLNAGVLNINHRARA